MPLEAISGLLRIRVVKIFAAGDAEITTDLPHQHVTHIDRVGYQPGNPGTTALGAFLVKLHAPGSEEYADARVLYDKLDYFMRLEFYISSDAASLGKFYWAGIVTEIKKNNGPNSVFELRGQSDLVLANLSRPFPGEMFSNDKTSGMVKSYLGTNELGWADQMNPFVGGVYTSTNIPGGTVATWAASTDEGLPVVSTAGAGANGACIIANTGAAAKDRWHTQFIEIVGRMQIPPDPINAGWIGVALTSANGNLNDCVLGYAQANNQNSAGRQVFSVFINVYAAGVLSTQRTYQQAIANVDDPEGVIPFTIGLLCTMGGQSSAIASATLIVNGRPILTHPTTAYDPGTTTKYPAIVFGQANSGTATVWVSSLIQMVRYSPDGPGTASVFAMGSITASAHSLMFGTDPGPSFLEVWSKLATREGWYWRYTPQPYVVGSRTLGVVDFGSDPSTDLSAIIQYKRGDGNLLELGLVANADSLATGTAASGLASNDGGGISYFRDIGSMIKYGVAEDQSLAFTASDFNSLRKSAYQIMINKISLGTSGAKNAVVFRDPSGVDVARELDRVLIDDPEIGINRASARILAIGFDEGQPTMTMVLDQFSVEWLG